MYTFYIDDELAEGLKRVKDADGISESEQIRRAIKAWLESRKGTVKAERKRAATRKRP
jgi:metal-responsive CopG/Arc/MetJ family transcriptional regulator